MELVEKETHIWINRADLADGYWVMQTSERHIAGHIERKFKRALLDVATTHEMGHPDRITSWRFKIAADVLPTSPFIRLRTRGGRGFRRQQPQDGKSHEQAPIALEE